MDLWSEPMTARVAAFLLASLLTLFAADLLGGQEPAARPRSHSPQSRRLSGHRGPKAAGPGTMPRPVVVIGLMIAAFAAIGLRFGLPVAATVLALTIAILLRSLWYTGPAILARCGARAVSDPILIEAVAELAAMAGIAAPRILEIEETHPNAFALGTEGADAAIVVTLGLRRRLTTAEQRAVIAREMSHIVGRDTVRATLGVTLMGAVATLALWLGVAGRTAQHRGVRALTFLVVLAPVSALVLRLGGSRARAYRADREGARLVRQCRRSDRGARQARHRDPALRQHHRQRPARGGGALHREPAAEFVGRAAVRGAPAGRQTHRAPASTFRKTARGRAGGGIRQTVRTRGDAERRGGEPKDDRTPPTVQVAILRSHDGGHDESSARRAAVDAGRHPRMPARGRAGGGDPDRHRVAHRCARRQAVRGCRTLREADRHGPFRGRSRAAAQPGDRRHRQGAARRRRARGFFGRPLCPRAQGRGARATALPCSTCSTAAARTSCATSIVRRRWPIRASEADFGDGFLMRRGFTLVWVGWQFDIPQRGGLMGLDAPVATEQGRPITGRVTTTFVPNSADPTYPLDDMGRYADTTRYPPLDPDSAASTLTVRDGFLGARTRDPARPMAVRPPARRHGGARHRPRSISRAGFAPGHVYELSYEAQKPPVAGLGFAALRDLAAALKHQTAGAAAGALHLAFGPSQDGRFLRRVSVRGLQRRRAGPAARSTASSPTSPARARRQRFQRALRAAQRPRLLRGVAVSRSSISTQRDPVTGKTDGLLDEAARSSAPENLLHQLVRRILGRRPRRGAHPYDARRPARCDAAGQCPHLSVRRHAACPGRISRLAGRGTAAAEPERICVGATARCWSRWSAGCATASRRRRAVIRCSRTTLW